MLVWLTNSLLVENIGEKYDKSKIIEINSLTSSVKYISGDFCEEEWDMCEDRPCAEGQNCTDLSGDVSINNACRKIELVCF